MKTFKIRCYDSMTKKHVEREIEGYPVELLEGYQFCAHESPTMYGIWNVSEISTGYCIAQGLTMYYAIRNAERTLKERKDEFVMLVSEVLQKNNVLFA